MQIAESEETRRRVLTTIAGKVGYGIFSSLSPVLTPPVQKPNETKDQVQEYQPPEQVQPNHDEPSSSDENDLVTEGSSEEDYFLNSYIY